MPPKTLIFIRHAQAEHNAMPKEKIMTDPNKHDASLTEVGLEQCAVLRKDITENPLVQKANLIIVSPMRRTLQTTQKSLDWLIKEGVPAVVDANWQEIYNKPCDTGTNVDELEKEFEGSGIDFSTIDPVWPDKSSQQAERYHATKDAILGRAKIALSELYQRDEEIIVIVSHSGFMRTAATLRRYGNADYRIFKFKDQLDTDGFHKLEEYPETKSVKSSGYSGGLGLSGDDNYQRGEELGKLGMD